VPPASPCKIPTNNWYPSLPLKEVEEIPIPMARPIGETSENEMI